MRRKTSDWGQILKKSPIPWWMRMSGAFDSEDISVKQLYLDDMVVRVNKVGPPTLWTRPVIELTLVLFWRQHIHSTNMH